MSPPKTITLLEQLERSGVNVDVDSYHLSWIKAVPFTPHDVTSNQIVIHQQIMLEENKQLVEDTIKEMKDADWLDIYTVLVRLIHGDGRYRVCPGYTLISG